MISIQQMHYVLVLSEQRQFQRASELCFVTQPTLSMQVKKAEEHLGFPIFDRSRNPIELTPFGESLIPVIREVLNESGKIEILLQKLKGNYKEQVKIGIIPTVAAYLVPDMFSTWQEKVGGVQLLIEEQKTEELLLSLERKELDMAILAGPVMDQRLRTIPLFKEEIEVYCPSLKQSKITTTDLADLHPWLLSRGNCLRTQMIQFCQLKDQVGSESWNYEGGNIEILLKMVDKNGGYSLVPEHYHLTDVQRSKLKSVYAPNNSGVPAREIIALVPNRTLKWDSLNRLIREMQLFYNTEKQQEMQVLDWS